MSEEKQNIKSSEESENKANTMNDNVEVSKLKPTQKLSSMYRTWFLDYASYVNLERAIPHINDGLKPVQRRVLHAMRRIDDGRYNKVANIVGDTMKFHPHGDASIGDALVNLGQKEYLIDCQGNWGNILTGDGAAAPRYIEARLSKFALEAVFNTKTTLWKPSYDGRNQEPISLPVKFPLLLAQGSEGIGLGLNSRILPHNYTELIEASIKHLKGEPFEIFPDFFSGGMIDVSKYNDGERGGKVKIRAHIEKVDNKTLKITDVPYGCTTTKMIDSIVRANEKGKIKIKKVEDNTAAHVEILVHLEAKTSSDKTIDALYAFTNCEMSYSPNCCVIDDNKPCFITVSDVLKRNTANTKALLKRELEIERNELLEQLMFASLEQLFIQKRIYKDKEFEGAKSNDEAIVYIEKCLQPYSKDFIREVTREDYLRLLDIKMARILRFNNDKAEEQMAKLRERIEACEHHLAHLTNYAIAWYTRLLNKFGKQFPRQTEIRSFEAIQVTKVAIRNEKLYFNKEEGFIGTNLRKGPQVEEVCKCSDLDDIIIFHKDGSYKIVRIAEKLYVGKNVIHLAVFVKNDKRTIYNVVYRDGKRGNYYIKRFAVYGVTRDKEYSLTKGTEGSKVVYFTVNPNGEAEVIRIILKATTRLKKRNMEFEKDFSEILIKGRGSMGNILTKADVRRVSLAQRGGSTLGGRKVWYDPDVMRLNYDERGTLLGVFDSKDRILAITNKGEYYTTNFDVTNHYSDIKRIEKLDIHKIWSVALRDAANGNNEYIKRFQMEDVNKPTSFIGDDENTKMWILTDTVYPRFEFTFGGHDAFRDPLIVEVDEFVGVKSCKAKGKRVTIYEVVEAKELEPTRFPEPPKEEPQEEIEIQEDVNQEESDVNMPTLFD